MWEFVKNNGSTLVVGGIVFGVLLAVALKLYKDKKSHKGGCGCGCSGCPSAGSCHPQNKKVITFK